MSNKNLLNKRRKLDEGLTTFYMRTHSSLLSERFEQQGNNLICHLHHVISAPLFGILMPIQFPPNSIIKYLNTYNVLISAQELLENFQHELWTDMFKAPKEPVGTISEANYFVVPLKDLEIDWLAIKRAVKLKPLLRITDFTMSTRKNLIIKTGYKSNATWKYMGEVNHNTTIPSFFSMYFGEAYPQLAEYVSKYASYDPIDVLMDENFKNESANGFRSFLVSGIIRKFDENTLLIFAKQTKSIKHKAPTVPKDKKSYPKGTPILISDLIFVYYLSSSHWSQGRNLLKALADIESFSYLIEFSHIYNYSGDFDILHEASQSPGLSPDCNYESLETLGDTVLKIVFTLHIYLNNLELSEHWMTRKRGWKVSNKCLAQKANIHNLKSFLKTKALKTNSYRPPYYKAKDQPHESYLIEHKVSDNMLADFVEALIGAFYLSKGILAAGEFMVKLGIVSEFGWDITSAYLSNDTLSILDKKDLEKFPERSLKISSLLVVPKQESFQNIFDYEFEDKVLLEQSLTHFTLNPNFNYERLEFLGDAIIDIIILSNIWKIQKFDPDYLTYFKHELVSNNTLAKISFITGLYKFMHVDEEVKKLIRTIYAKKLWDEDMYCENDIVFNMPKCLGDIFESVVAAVLLDSRSLALTCMIFGYIFCNLILYMVKNKERYKKRIIARLCEEVTGNGDKIEFREFLIDGVHCVQVYINDEFVHEDFGDSLKNAKDNACLYVYNKYNSMKKTE